MSNNRAHLSTSAQSVEVQKVAPPSSRTRPLCTARNPLLGYSFLVHDRAGPPAPHPRVSTYFPFPGYLTRARTHTGARAAYVYAHKHSLSYTTEETRIPSTHGHIHIQRRNVSRLRFVSVQLAQYGGKSIQGNQEAAAGRRQQRPCRLHPGTTPTRRLVFSLYTPFTVVNLLVISFPVNVFSYLLPPSFFFQQLLYSGVFRCVVISIFATLPLTVFLQYHAVVVIDCCQQWILIFQDNPDNDYKHHHLPR